MDAQKQVLPFEYKPPLTTSEENFNYVDVSSYLSSVRHELESSEQVFFSSRRKLMNFHAAANKRKRSAAAAAAVALSRDEVVLDYGNDGDIKEVEMDGNDDDQCPVPKKQDTGVQRSVDGAVNNMAKEIQDVQFTQETREKFIVWKDQFIEDFKIQKRLFNGEEEEAGEQDEEFEVGIQREHQQNNEEESQNEIQTNQAENEVKDDESTNDSDANANDSIDANIVNSQTITSISHVQPVGNDHPQNQEIPTRFPDKFTAWRAFMLNHKPTKPLLQALPHHTVLRLIIYMKKLVNKSMKGNLNLWSLALFLKLTDVLEYGEVHELREVSKKLLYVRQKENTPDEVKMVCDVVIVIVYEIYGQKDLKFW